MTVWRWPMKDDLTEEIYDYILHFAGNHCGVTPTIRQIMGAVGLTSTSLVHRHVGKLEKQGKLNRNEYDSPQYWVVGSRWFPPEG